MSTFGKTILSSSQVEFMAGDCLVSIIPKQDFPAFNLISGDIKSLTCFEESTVPLWLALFFKQSNSCIIVPPKWLDKDYLENVLNSEQGEANLLPYHWVEISNALLDSFSDDIPDHQEIRCLIEHIWDKRSSKMCANLLEVVKLSDVVYVHLTKLNLGAMEINTIKPFFLETINQLHSLSDAATSNPPKEN